MSQRLSHLEERQHKISSSMGFEVPEPVVYPPPAVENPRLGTAMPTMMVKMMMKTTPTMRLKKSLNEDDVFLSLFLVFDAKGGKEVLSIYSSYFMSLACSSLRLYYETKCVFKFCTHPCLYELMLLMYSYAYYLSMCMHIMLLSIYYSWMIHGERKNSLFVLKLA
jgi:hypothetical protein